MSMNPPCDVCGAEDADNVFCAEHTPENESDAYDRGYKQATSDMFSQVREAESLVPLAVVTGAAVAFGLMGMAFAIQAHERDRCRDCGHWGEPVTHDPRTLCLDEKACDARLAQRMKAALPGKGSPGIQNIPEADDPSACDHVATRYIASEGRRVCLDCEGYVEQIPGAERGYYRLVQPTDS